MAGQQAGLDLQGLEKISQRLRIVSGLRLLAAQVITQAVARRIPGDHPPAGRQSCQLKAEIVGMRTDAVQHDDAGGVLRTAFEIGPTVAQVARLCQLRNARQPQGRQRGPGARVGRCKLILMPMPPHRLRFLVLPRMREAAGACDWRQFQ